MCQAEQPRNTRRTTSALAAYLHEKAFWCSVMSWLREKYSRPRVSLFRQSSSASPNAEPQRHKWVGGRKRSRTPLVTITEVGEPKLSLQRSTEGPKTGPSLCDQALSASGQASHPHLRLKRPQLRLATVTGTGRKKPYVRLWG